MLIALPGTPLPAIAQDAGLSFAGALAAGRPILEVRPRYQRIDESDKPQRAEGWTLRAIAGWRSAPWQGFRFTVEGIHAEDFGADRFNVRPTAPSPYPLLPDPRRTGWNQAFVDHEGAGALHLRAGRQRVRMDNQRWISDNDFRQTPMLFDGLSATHTGVASTRLFAGHYRRVRTTSGVDNPLRLTLLNAAYNPASGHTVGAYAYFHEQAQNGAFTGFADNSYRVVGARAEGAVAIGRGIDMPYIAEVAGQKAHGDGDDRIDARYWRVGGGVSWRELTLRVDQEVKGSNRGLYGVQMPLTDFYGFNGWTLHFFNTPRAGLRDRWLTLRQAWREFVFYAEHHRFRSDFGDYDYGKETDAGLTWSLAGGWDLRLQHARYDPGGGGIGARVRKTWLTLTYAY